MTGRVLSSVIVTSLLLCPLQVASNLFIYEVVDDEPADLEYLLFLFYYSEFLDCI